MTASLLPKYRALHDGLSDMIEEGRLNEADIPDDYRWLVDTLVEIAGLDPAKVVLKEMEPPSIRVFNVTVQQTVIKTKTFRVLAKNEGDARKRAEKRAMGFAWWAGVPGEAEGLDVLEIREVTE